MAPNCGGAAPHSRSGEDNGIEFWDEPYLASRHLTSFCYSIEFPP